MTLVLLVLSFNVLWGLPTATDLESTQHTDGDSAPSTSVHHYTTVHLLEQLASTIKGGPESGYVEAENSRVTLQANVDDTVVKVVMYKLQDYKAPLSSCAQSSDDEDTPSENIFIKTKLMGTLTDKPSSVPEETWLVDDMGCQPRNISISMSELSFPPSLIGVKCECDKCNQGSNYTVTHHLNTFVLQYVKEYGGFRRSSYRLPVACGCSPN